MVAGTKSILGPFCGLARGNSQWPGVLGFLSEPKISRFNSLMNFQEQFTHYEKSRSDRTFAELLSLKIVEYEPQTR